MARKVFYRYNPNTLAYERIYPSIGARLVSWGKHVLVGLLVGVVFFLIFYHLFESPQEKKLRADNEQMVTQYRIFSHRLDEALEVMDDIRQRDDNLYRIIVQADPIDNKIRNGGVKNSSLYKELQDLSNAGLVISSAQKLDLLSRQLYVQSISFDEIMEMAKRNEDRINRTPAIQPISNKDLKRTASGYGWRIDPIYNVRKFHAGMDFAANLGTPVYATADGTVSYAGWKQGYGNTVMIDHGYGYQTLYGHLSKIDTKVGRKVVRGEMIAEVGSTGKSTGPHLHYEVRYKGHYQPPINYYFFDLSPEDYDLMTQMAENNGLVMD
ncbi:MAG: M23 family metallopeptidase [Porphyromonadaceae bacterium]|nr:M23 family metallopeptidase [Porphyromonadaceae bacterium]